MKRVLPTLLLVHAALAGAAFGGPPVREIRFDSPIPVDEDTFRRAIPLRVDGPLDTHHLEQSLLWLREKEIFRSVDVETEATGNGVKVTFRLVPVRILVGTRVSGSGPLDADEIRRRSRLREGEPVTEADLEGAAKRIELYTRSEGFPEARVDFHVEEDAPDQVFVTIAMRPGDPVVLANLDVRPTDGVLPKLVDRLPFAEGSVWTPESLRRGRRALLAALRDGGWYEAEVRGDEEVVGNAARAAYEVRLGVPFEIEIDGNRSLPRDTLLGLVDLGARPVVTDGTWRGLARRMMERYREDGFAFVKVSVKIERAPRRKRVRFAVDEGERVRIVGIRFRGNRAIGDEALREGWRTREAGILPWPRDRGVLLDDVFREDLERLRARYAAEGYEDARILDVKFRFSVVPNDLEITLEIHEGQPTRITEIVTTGPWPEAESGSVEDVAGLRPGEILGTALVDRARERLRRRLRELGHPDARVEIRIDRVEGKGVRLVVEADPGERVLVGAVRVRGNLFTLDRVIRRSFRVATGDPLDLERIREAQGELYHLGLFRSVSVTMEPTTGPVRDLIVRVRERPAGEVEYGIGYDTRIGFRNGLGISHRNVRGTGRRVSLRGELNLSPNDLDPDEYLGNLGLREPFVQGLPFDARLDVVFQRSTRDIDEFSVRRFSVATGIERELRRLLTLSLLLELDDSRIFDVAPDAVLTGKDVGRLRTVSWNPIVVWDRRDDPFVPARGTFETLRLRYGSPAMGSQVHFFKAVGQHSHYVPLPGNLTAIYALRAGIAEPLGSSEIVPIRERFFLGGRTTVRGFEENAIGPVGENGNPIGGDVLTNVNLELHVPVAGGLSLAGFFDAGGVYLRSRGITLEGFREAAGPGVRFRTPIGSVSFDYGIKLDRRAGESAGEFHFTIGNIF